MKPAPGLFLGLVAATLWVGGRRSASYALGIPRVLVVAFSALFFPFSGRQPMAWNSALLPALAGLAVVLLVPRHWRLLRAGGALYVVFVVLAWLVPSPVGTNIGRLGLLFGGVVLVAGACDARARTSWAGRHLGRRGAAIALAVALITSAAWQVARAAARDAVTTRPPASFTTDLDPLLAQVAQRRRTRVASRWCPRAVTGRPPRSPRTCRWPAAGTGRPTPSATALLRRRAAHGRRLRRLAAPLGGALRRRQHRRAGRRGPAGGGDPDRARRSPSSPRCGPTPTGGSTRWPTPRRWSPRRRGWSPSTPAAWSSRRRGRRGSSSGSPTRPG